MSKDYTKGPKYLRQSYEQPQLFEPPSLASQKAKPQRVRRKSQPWQEPQVHREEKKSWGYQSTPWDLSRPQKRILPPPLY